MQPLANISTTQANTNPSWIIGPLANIHAAQANENTLAIAAAASAKAKASQVTGLCSADQNTVASDDCIRETFRNSECDGTGTFVADDPFFSTSAGWALPPEVKRDATRTIANATQKDIAQTLQLWQWYRRFAPESTQAKRCSSTPYWPRMMEKAAPNSRPLNEEWKIRDASSGSPVVYPSQDAAIKACRTAPQRGLYPADNAAGLIGHVMLHDPNQQQGFCSAVWRAEGGQGQALFDPRLRGVRSSAFSDKYSFFPKTCWNGPGSGEPCDMVTNMIGVGSNFTGQGLYWQNGAYDGNTKMPSGDGWWNARAACMNDVNCPGVWRSWTEYAAVPYLYDPRVTSPSGLATNNELFTQPFYNMVQGPWFEGIGGYATPNPSMFGTVPANFAYPLTADLSLPSTYSTNLPTAALLDKDVNAQYTAARQKQTDASNAARAAEAAVVNAITAYAAAKPPTAAQQTVVQTAIVAARNAANVESVAINATSAIIVAMTTRANATLSVQSSLGSAGGGDCQWWAPQSGVQPISIVMSVATGACVAGGDVYCDAVSAGKACAAGSDCIGVWQSDTGGPFHVVRTSAGPGNYTSPLTGGNGIFWRKSCRASELAAFEGEKTKAAAKATAEQKAISDRLAAEAAAAADAQLKACAANAATVKVASDAALKAANDATANVTTQLTALQGDIVITRKQKTGLEDQLTQLKQLTDAVTEARDNAIKTREAAITQLGAASKEGFCSVM